MLLPPGLSLPRRSSHDPLKIEMDESITDIFTHNPDIPHTLLDSIEFRRTLQIALPGYIPPTRKTLTRHLFPGRHKKLSTKVQQLLSSANAVTLTIDIWSSRQMKSFLGVSAHCIVDWHLHTIMLACKRMKGHHTALVHKSTIATDKLEEERRLLTANTTRCTTVSSQCFAFPRRSLILCNFPPNSLPLTATF